MVSQLEKDFIKAPWTAELEEDVNELQARVAAASANTATAPGGSYVQGEVQAILTELRDLKTKMRAAGLLAV